MEHNKIKKLKRKILFLFPTAFLFLALMLFIPAGSLNYWQGWVFCLVLLFPVLFVTLYFLKRSPEFLERRMMYKEKETEQKTIIKFGSFIFFLGFLIPGLDFRFGWSSVPLWLIIVSNIIILLGYFLIFLSFKENVFAGRTVEVFKGQKVIDSGPYALIRHPMYAGFIPMFLFMPIALGSYWAIIAFIPECIIIILRALNEEDVLKRDLPGYKDYCKKVRYRLIPLIW